MLSNFRNSNIINTRVFQDEYFSGFLFFILYFHSFSLFKYVYLLFYNNNSIEEEVEVEEKKMILDVLKADASIALYIIHFMYSNRKKNMDRDSKRKWKKT